MGILSPYDALVQAYQAFGSQQAMAKALGVTQPTVWRWLNHTKRLPPKHVLAVETATGVSRYDLGPDIYPRGRQRTRKVPMSRSAAA